MQSRLAQALAALMIALMPHSAPAQILPAFGPKEASFWRAVGVVNIEGPAGVAECSGTLIAPDLVLTAAHCAWGETRWFLVGGIGAQALSVHPSASIAIHPDYTQATGMDKFFVDIAVITLATPVPAAIATPLPLADAIITAERYAIVGFHRMRPRAPNGRFDCPASTDAPKGRLFLDCQVIAGNSGAPALVETVQGWQVAGVITARMGGPERHRAIVAPVNDWLREQLR